jgi:signal transduction histidine kinase
VQCNIKARLEGERDTMNYRFRGRTKEGETIEVDAHGARIEYNGQPAILGTAVDITERMRLQREMLNMQESERRRIGQDLHDSVASQLTGVGIMLATLNRREGVTNEMAHQVDEIRQLIEESTQEIRRLSRGLAPAGLCGKSLVDALERLADNIEGARFAMEAADVEVSNDEAAAHLYWIAQEAATNAQKYAAADTITIRLRRDDDALALDVEDDGEGFSLERARDESFGLRTMQYRAELLGGTLSIDTAPGAGTRITCRLPA